MAALKSLRYTKLQDLNGILREYQSFLKGELDSVARANSTIRHALLEAGKMWIAVFLPKRFEMNYATTYLNYHSS